MTPHLTKHKSPSIIKFQSLAEIKLTTFKAATTHLDIAHMTMPTNSKLPCLSENGKLNLKYDVNR